MPTRKETRKRNGGRINSRNLKISLNLHQKDEIQVVNQKENQETLTKRRCNVTIVRSLDILQMNAVLAKEGNIRRKKKMKHVLLNNVLRQT